MPNPQPDFRFRVLRAFAGRSLGAIVEAFAGATGSYLTGPDLLAVYDWPRPLSSYLLPITPEARELLDALELVDAAIVV